MTIDKAIKELKEAQELGDPEVAHLYADNILITFLRANGFGKIADKWELVPDKWYA